MLRLSNIRKDYITSSETVHALKGVSISFRKSEFVSILGPSGCGKTTLLNIVGGLDHYTDGDLVIGGRSTKSYTDRDWDVYRNHRVGFIFQSYNLIPHQTVLGNVELALTIAGISREERVERSKRALDRVGLSGQYYKKPNQLSGGQCQRVAIARALVNDPEILLADEPTGALDTVTSVQIMDLIKEISNERLVIMVTHNPELAEKYSSRIVRLLDGEIIEDTNPFAADDEIAECEAIAREQEEEEARILAEAADEKERQKIKRERKQKRERAKMSFFTAFRLSWRNLLSKLGRTSMVAFAGSIGIIGIALVLAFSSGIKGYIASMQDDMLSGNPIKITETAYDLDAFSGMIDNQTEVDITKLADRVYVNSLIEYLVKTNKHVEDMVVSNELTKDYIDYLKSMPSEYYADIVMSYGIDINPNLFTEVVTDEGNMTISIKRITDMYTSILGETEYNRLAYMIPMLAPTISQAPSNTEYLLSQYDLLGEGSRIATERGEIMLVVDRDDELSDLLLARYGYYSQAQFLELINKANADGEFESDIYKNNFTYDELLGKEFTYYPTNDIFKEGNATLFNQSGYTYLSNAEDIEAEGVKLTVVGILSPKENISYGCMRSGIYYTEALTDYIIETNTGATDGILNFLRDDENASKLSTNIPSMDMSFYGLMYTYSYIYDEDGDPETKNEKTGFGVVSYTSSTSDMMQSVTGTGQSLSNTDQRDRFLRSYGANDNVNSVTIYPKSFDDMYLVTDYLDKWNEEGELTVGDKTYADRSSVTYTNTLEIVISLVNTMIDVVSYALIAFTSISLVVSTVMIGIITYVSVVERIKEIGVIRALGGRKRDVSYLFNAETFIIGAVAGIIGICATYLISFIANILLTPLINYSGIAALALSDAVWLVILSIVLTLISGLIPARSAANKDPVVALRTE